MSSSLIAAVAAGGALGSAGRYLVAIYANRLFGPTFPWGTLIINVSGSFLIGALVQVFALRWNVGPVSRAFLVVGICGGFTTFSTFSLDLVTLAGRGDHGLALAYAVASTFLSILALCSALYVGRLALS